MGWTSIKDVKDGLNHLGQVLRCRKPAGQKLWNVDETGLQDHFLPQNVAAEPGKLCYQATAGEKENTTTVVATFNAVRTKESCL